MSTDTQSGGPPFCACGGCRSSVFAIVRMDVGRRAVCRSHLRTQRVEEVVNLAE